MSDFDAAAIHRLDQAYPDAIAGVDKLVVDPHVRAKLAEFGPAIAGAILTADLAGQYTPAGCAGMAALATIRRVQERDELDRLRAELRDKGSDLLEVRGILSPNGCPRRVPEPIGETVAPSVQWLANEVDRLRAEVEDLRVAKQLANRRLCDEAAALAADEEPTTPGAPVRDGDGDIWTRGDDGLWHCPGVKPRPWRRLYEEWRPLFLVPDEPAPAVGGTP